MSVYRKYCYWMNLDRLETVSKSLREKEIELPEEAHIPCRALRETTEIGCVVPQAWDGFCKRRTSWYSGSERAGQFLIASRHPLDLPDLGNPILIAESDFKPDRLPTSGEIAELAGSAAFQSRKPAIWDRIEPAEKDFQRRWLERHEVNEPLNFDEIFMIHSANHSNFIAPKFYHGPADAKSPYSISGSTHVCSSCLEFFNILGEQWPVKYVVPCIGAVQFARLPRDRYLRVEKIPGFSD